MLSVGRVRSIFYTGTAWIPARSSGCSEAWKRRQAIVGVIWGELGTTKPPPAITAQGSDKFVCAVKKDLGIYSQTTGKHAETHRPTVDSTVTPQ